MTTEDIVPAATIRNTSDPREVELTGLLMLANAMSGGSTEDLILNQEAAGQRQLVNSDRLPTESNNTDAEFAAIGVTLGDPDPSDPLFRPAILPDGWRREATDHSMHSKVVDQHGRERISVFYKAAFYDRKAHMYLITPGGYLRTVVGWENSTPVLDDVWLTADIAVEALTKLEAQEISEAQKGDEYAKSARASNPDYWVERAAEHRTEAARYAAARERIEVTR